MSQAGIVIGRDNDPGARLPLLNQASHLVFRANCVGQLEIIGSPVGIQKRARFTAEALIENNQRNVAYIAGGGVAQQEKLDHWDDQDNDQGAFVAHDLGEFLADDGN